WWQPQPQKPNPPARTTRRALRPRVEIQRVFRMANLPCRDLDGLPRFHRGPGRSRPTRSTVKPGLNTPRQELDGGREYRVPKDNLTEYELWTRGSDPAPRLHVGCQVGRLYRKSQTGPMAILRIGFLLILIVFLPVLTSWEA